MMSADVVSSAPRLSCRHVEEPRTSWASVLRVSSVSRHAVSDESGVNELLIMIFQSLVRLLAAQVKLVSSHSSTQTGVMRSAPVWTVTVVSHGVLPRSVSWSPVSPHHCSALIMSQVDSEGWVVDHAWGDCDTGCPGTLEPCDDRYFSIQEGKCIDVSVPGAIPNWSGAPVVKLLDPTPQLLPAPVCQSKGQVERLYDNTCRCARGNTALDISISGRARGNCTGLYNHKFQISIVEDLIERC